jgi:primary-amine oxidase
MRLIPKLIGMLMLSAVWSLASAREALAVCPGGFPGPGSTVTRTFDTGASWTFTVAKAPCEGLVLFGVQYQVPFEPSRTVLTRATIAEVHVPYDNNVNRFLDVTESTDGLGTHALALDPAECEDGTLHLNNEVCVKNEDGGYRFKEGTVFAKMRAVSVFMASRLGAYTYINRWDFREDGTIEVMVGLTGQLQRYSNTASDAPQFGSTVGAFPQTIGLNHQHNFYYRLDFDLDGAANDVVQRVTYAPFSAAGACASSACGKTTYSPILTEQAQTWTQSAQTMWLVQDKVTVNADGRRIGYMIKPHYTGTWRGKTDGSESWAQHDVFVTRFNGCELLAARNLNQFTGCSGTNAANVFAMVNGESTDGQDVVVWFVNRHHHVTRDEDEFYMPIEWTGFEISPHQWSYQNPAQGF